MSKCQGMVDLTKIVKTDLKNIVKTILLLIILYFLIFYLLFVHDRIDVYDDK